MEKEKQIEEMVEIAYNAICIQIGGGDFVDPGDRHAAPEIVSEDLYKAGYGNVKEALKEFAERIKMAFYYEFDELIPSIMSDKIDEIAKEYGVEDEK